MASPVASILNLPEVAASSGEPAERLIQDVAAVLSNLHRFGRDFHGKDGLLHEDVYSSMIAVGLRLLGWAETDREAVQAAGYTDVKVRLVNLPRVEAHAILEVKLWHGSYNQGIQKQLDHYRVSDTHHGVAITLGERDTEGWPEDYEQTCLAERSFVRLETPPDLVGRWRVRGATPEGQEWITDHLLVQIPKRR
jgi:hypothetical protein